MSRLFFAATLGILAIVCASCSGRHSQSGSVRVKATVTIPQTETVDLQTGKVSREGDLWFEARSKGDYYLRPWSKASIGILQPNSDCTSASYSKKAIRVDSGRLPHICALTRDGLESEVRFTRMEFGTDGVAELTADIVTWSR